MTVLRVLALLPPAVLGIALSLFLVWFAVDRFGGVAWLSLAVLGGYAASRFINARTDRDAADGGDVYNSRGV